MPGGKRARPLVPPRLALLAIRRKLISGGSHNWGGGASETPTSQVLEILLYIQAFLLILYTKLKKDKGN